MEVTPEQKAAIDAEAEKRVQILNRMHNLRKTLCRANCKALLHRPACKAMKKDIEYLKEIIL
jgi:hypothetical protein